MSTFAELIAQTTSEGGLYNRLPDDRLLCYACGERLVARYGYPIRKSRLAWLYSRCS